MKNYKQPGRTLTVAAPYDVASGAGFQVGIGFAVATASAVSGAPVEGATTGVFGLPKATGVAATLWGAAYWDNAAKVVTPTAGGNLKIGIFTAAAASGATACDVRLNGAF